jgi:hypothetical protein
VRALAGPVPPEHVRKRQRERLRNERAVAARLAAREFDRG